MPSLAGRDSAAIVPPHVAPPDGRAAPQERGTSSQGVETPSGGPMKGLFGTLW